MAQKLYQTKEIDLKINHQIIIRGGKRTVAVIRNQRGLKIITDVKTWKRI